MQGLQSKGAAGGETETSGSGGQCTGGDPRFRPPSSAPHTSCSEAAISILPLRSLT